MKTLIRLIQNYLMAMLATGIAVAPLNAGETISFDQLWNWIKQSSPVLDAAKQGAEAADVAAGRASRHWVPRIYGDARAYNTNDPAQSFVSTLNQRAIAANDFMPGTLNEPDRKTYGRGALGVDLPLFEGLGALSRSHAAEYFAESGRYQLSLTRQSLYAELAKSYATLISLKTQERRLLALQEDLQSVIQKYRLGNRANPVGYSGSLGLQSLENRVTGLIAENNARQRAIRGALALQAKELGPEFSNHGEIRETVFISFLEDKIPVDPNRTPTSVSLSERAARSQAEGMSALADSEKSRLLPRVGLFGELAYMKGSRDGASSTTAGAYLQWDLFSGAHIGTLDESRARAQSAMAQADAQTLRIRSDRLAVQEAIPALKRSLELVAESLKLLDEQAKVSRDLFRSGSINALQYAEVLNRRADLFAQAAELEMTYAEKRAALYQLQAKGDL